MFVGCCVCSTLVGIEYGIIYPTIFVYLKSLGSKPQLHMGLASALFSLARTFTFVPLGAVADRVGARAPCVIFFIIAGLGNLYYFAARRPGDVVAARCVVGFGSSVTSVLMGIVGRASDGAAQRSVRDRRLAVYNATSLLAILAGPGLSACFAFVKDGTESDRHPLFTRYSGPGLVMSILMGICALWALLCLPSNAPIRPRSDTDAVAVDARETILADAAVAADGAGEGIGEKWGDGRDAYGALVTSRGASTLVVAFVGGAMIAALDTGFPIVAHSDFNLNPTLIAALLASFASVGVLAIVASEVVRRGRDTIAARVAVLRVGTGLEVVGGVVGLCSFAYLDVRTERDLLGKAALVTGALCVFGTMFATTPNAQLLAAVANMRRHAGYYSGLRAVSLSLGRAVGGFMAGLLLGVSAGDRHLPIFEFVAGMACLGFFAVLVFPPRQRRETPQALDAPLLEGLSSEGA